MGLESILFQANVCEQKPDVMSEQEFSILTLWEGLKAQKSNVLEQEIYCLDKGMNRIRLIILSCLEILYSRSIWIAPNAFEQQSKHKWHHFFDICCKTRRISTIIIREPWSCLLATRHKGFVVSQCVDAYKTLAKITLFMISANMYLQKKQFIFLFCKSFEGYSVSRIRCLLQTWRVCIFVNRDIYCVWFFGNMSNSQPPFWIAFPVLKLMKIADTVY